MFLFDIFLEFWEFLCLVDENPLVYYEFANKFCVWLIYFYLFLFSMGTKLHLHVHIFFLSFVLLRYKYVDTVFSTQPFFLCQLPPALWKPRTYVMYFYLKLFHYCLGWPFLIVQLQIIKLFLLLRNQVYRSLRKEIAL